MEITVRAAAQGRRVPEIAVLTVRVSRESANQQQAASAAHTLMRQLSDQVRQIQADRPEIVDRLVVSPVGTRSWRPWNNEGKQLPMQHESSGRVQIALTDFDLVARLTQEWSGVDGLNLSAPHWELTEQSQRELETEVTTEAVKLCRRRAQVMATASGFDQVTPLQVADTGLLERPQAEAAPAPMMARAGAASAADEGFDLSPREIQVRIQVEARFRAD
ncbi:SIMPL domain-containing protein [Propionibacteriaceae bacterium Y1923]